MDLKTIIILTTFSNIIIFIFLALFIKLGTVKNKILQLYAIAKFIQSAGLILILLRGLVPEIISIALANSLIIIGISTEVFSIVSYNNRNLKKRAKIFSGIALFLVLGFLMLINSEANSRIAYMSFVYFVWQIIGFQQLISFRKYSKTAFVAGIIYGILSIPPLVRTIMVLFVFKEDTIFDSNIIQTVSYSALFLFNFVSVLLLLLLLKEQDEKIIVKSEEKYRSIIENLQDVYFRTNMDGKLLMISPSAKKLFGYNSIDEALGLNVQKEFYVFPEKRVSLMKALKEGDGKMSNFELDLKKKDGSIITVLVSSSYVYDENENLVGVEGIFTNITERKKAEQQIRKLSIAVEQSANTIVLTDTEGEIEYTNPKFTEVTGYSTEEAKGQNPRILNSETQPKEYYEEMWKTISEGNIWKGEFCNKKKNGNFYWEQVTITPIKDDMDQIVNYLAIKEDITEKKEAKTALKESEEKFRAIVETASDWIWEINADGKYTYSSPNILSILGYTEKEILGKTPFDLMQEIEKNRITKIFTDIVSQKKPIHNLENTNIHKNGHIVVMETSGLPFFDAKGELIGYRGIDRDITEKIEIRRALKESVEHLELAQNAGKIGTWEWNIKTDEIIWSDMAYEIFDLQKSKQTITGDQYFKYVHPEDKLRIETELNNALKQNKKEHKTEYRIITNNNIKWLDETSRIIYESGELAKMIGVLQDVTDRKNAENALRKSEASLRQSNETKDLFFSIIAHDLKSPFNTMIGFSDLLINNFDDYDVDEQKSYLGIINQSIHNTYKLLENLLLWSQEQKGIIDFKPETENLFLLCRETCTLLNQLASNKSLTLINHINESLSVVADRNMLLTILRNLISNAIKFTPKGGTIEIGVKARHALSQQPTNVASPIEIYVKDNGTGMEKQKISELFKITEKVSSKGTEGETGTGLSLILCKEFIEKHGGKIWVESEVGKGSEFIFTLAKV